MSSLLNEVLLLSYLILDDVHQEEGRRGQGGSESGAPEGPDDPAGGSVCAAASDHHHTAGDRATAVQVQHIFSYLLSV